MQHKVLQYKHKIKNGVIVFTTEKLESKRVVMRKEYIKRSYKPQHDVAQTSDVLWIMR